MDTTYRPGYLPVTREIRETFADEIASLGGVVPDVYEDDAHLFARAVLPADIEVRPGDRVRSGVAVRSAGPEILVYPYTFRQVCSNGAISTHALQGRRLDRTESAGLVVPTSDVAVVLSEIRLAIRACASREAFATATREMRSATEVRGELGLDLLPLFGRIPLAVTEQVLSLIFERFEASQDRSGFGLMNAVTSVAHDTRDPETRWRLEELGGDIAARLGTWREIEPAVPALASA